VAQEQERACGQRVALGAMQLVVDGFGPDETAFAHPLGGEVDDGGSSGCGCSWGGR
jgi:hypothetical protein